eukprot:m.196021 g.196021  ORF g.196021 m.196021 type:complete len:177 (-) comp18317_c1_seq2:186-716(-)
MASASSRGSGDDTDFEVNREPRETTERQPAPYLGGDDEGDPLPCTLVFLEDGAWFQGRCLCPHSNRQIGLLGELTSPPKQHAYHECCFEAVPTFYKVTCIDFGSGVEWVLSHVMKLGGDNGKLDSDALYFETERLLVSAEARDHIGRYFTRVDLTDPKNADPWVCVGTAKILEPSV